MKNLRVILFFAAVTVTALSYSCSRRELELDNPPVVVVSPDNPNNPFDMVGKIHNEAVKQLGYSSNFPNFTEKDFESATCQAWHKYFPDQPCDFSFLVEARVDTIDSVGTPAVEAIGEQISNVIKMDTTMPVANAYQALHSQVVAIEDATQNNPALTEVEKMQILINASVARHSAYLWSTDIPQNGDTCAGAWYPTLQCPNSEKQSQSARLTLDKAKAWVKKNEGPLKATAKADAKGALVGAIKGAIRTGTPQGALISAGIGAVKKSVIKGVQQDWQ
jgi:hypothetical protein